MELGPGSFPIVLSGKRPEYFLDVFCEFCEQGFTITLLVTAVERTEKVP